MGVLYFYLVAFMSLPKALSLYGKKRREMARERRRFVRSDF